MLEEELKELKIKKYVNLYLKIINNVLCKKCFSCKEWLDINLFCIEGLKKYINNERKWWYNCNKCRNIKRNEKRKNDFIFKLELNLRCRLYCVLID